MESLVKAGARTFRQKRSEAHFIVEIVINSLCNRTSKAVATVPRDWIRGELRSRNES
jgi:hypothetical protein